MPDERAGLVKGIPAVTSTPARVPNLCQMFIEGILRQAGKPVPEDYETYEEFIEALVVWKLDQPSPQQAAKTKPIIDDFETYEDFTEAFIEWKISQRSSPSRTLKQRSEDAVNKALPSEDPADWRELREILDECFAVGTPLVSFSILEPDGIVRPWLIEQAGKGVVGHREDGSGSFFWSEESGVLTWVQERLPATI